MKIAIYTSSSIIWRDHHSKSDLANFYFEPNDSCWGQKRQSKTKNSSAYSNVKFYKMMGVNTLVIYLHGSEYTGDIFVEKTNKNLHRSEYTGDIFAREESGKENQKQKRKLCLQHFVSSRIIAHASIQRGERWGKRRLFQF